MATVPTDFEIHLPPGERDMADPCKQEGVICGLSATIESVKDTLERLSDGQEKFIGILEKISQQSEAIATFKKQQNDLFARVRQVEIETAQERVKIAAIVSVISLVVGVITAAISRHLWK